MLINKQELLKKLEDSTKDCQSCSLAGTRKNLVFGKGSPNARVLLIGEGPGADEDRLGQPFVGKAGQLLDKIIFASNIPQEDIYICNVVKCRPPANRFPTPMEVIACKPYLREQLRIINPDLIVCLGSLAAQVLIAPDAKITQIRGQWVKKGAFLIMPTFHPAALLRDESKKRLVWEDIKKVCEQYQQLQTT